MRACSSRRCRWGSSGDSAPGKSRRAPRGRATSRSPPRRSAPGSTGRSARAAPTCYLKAAKNLKADSDLQAVGRALAGAVDLGIHVEQQQLESRADEELVEREVLLAEIGDVRRARHPGAADADIGRQHEETLGRRDVEPLGAHVELVDARQLRVGAPYAHRGRGN